MKVRALVVVCAAAALITATPAAGSSELRVRGGGQLDEGAARPSTIAFTASGGTDGVRGEVEYVRHGEPARAVHGEVVCLTGTDFGPARRGVARIDFRVLEGETASYFELQVIDNGQGSDGEDTIALLPISEADVCSPFGPMGPDMIPLPVTDSVLGRGNVQVDGLRIGP